MNKLIIMTLILLSCSMVSKAQCSMNVNVGVAKYDSKFSANGPEMGFRIGQYISPHIQFNVGSTLNDMTEVSRKEVGNPKCARTMSSFTVGTKLFAWPWTSRNFNIFCTINVGDFSNKYGGFGQEYGCGVRIKAKSNNDVWFELSTKYSHIAGKMEMCTVNISMDYAFHSYESATIMRRSRR